MSDTAYGDIMEEKRKLMEQDDGWSYFEEKNVIDRFKELYKRVEFLEKSLSENAGSCAVKVQGIDFDSKGSIEDGIDLV